MLRFLLCLLAAFSTFSLLDAAAYDVYHSFDGTRFSRLGKIDGSIQDKSLTLQRTFSTDDQEKLKAAIEKDGFYKLRVSAGGYYIATVVRASCFAAPNVQEKVAVQHDEDGRLMTLSYTVVSPTCNSSPATVTLPSFTPELAVEVAGPRMGPALTSQEALGDAIIVDSSGMPSQRSGGSSGAGATNRPLGMNPGAGAGAGAGVGAGASQGQTGDDKPPPDERTWWQKNWLFVVGGAMAVMNIMGNMARSAQQGQGGAAGGAGRGAGARR